MPISFRCSGCGKEYRVDEKRAGKQAKCRCGATTRISPESATQSGEDLDDWVASAFRTSPAAAPPSAPEPAPTPEPEPETPPPAPAIERPERKRYRKYKPSRRHKLVAVASIAYGALAAMVVLGIAAMSFPAGIFGWTADVVLAVAIAVGGVLILKRHRHGPACAGLASICLCFFGAWNVFWNIVGALSTGQFQLALALLAFLLAVYSVPVGITVWCLREEMKIQELEAEEC